MGVAPLAFVLAVTTQSGAFATAQGCQIDPSVTFSQVMAVMCQAEMVERAADALPEGGPARPRVYEDAARLFRRAADLAAAPGERVMALEGLARIYARERLNLPLLEESVLRELIGLMPSDIALLFRLAALQERQARIDDAEDTLQMARRQQPDQLEPYRQLAQFYARRAVAIQPRPQPIVPASTAAADAAEAARPDDRGVFSIGGAVTPPRREDVAQMPEDAKLLGVEGAVRIEVVIDEDGSVQDATIVRSVPLLDAEALRAVRHWRFAPTIVDGKAVPVRMQVVVNFRQ